ncbi:MAG: ABC transporter permease, partial [Candidatus Hydrogenedentes bacterium]|nr:ABC transporter permease [Candidatus Hydrogenedentota bacterium]
MALKYRDKLQLLEKELQQARKRGATEDEIAGLQEMIEKIVESTRVNPPDYRAILGLGIPGLSFRTDRGEIIRYLVPGHRIILLVVPLGERYIASGIQPNIRKFTIIDDNQSGVYSIDKKFVYVPFDTLQLLNNMGAEWSDEQPPRLITPKRCSQIHIKIRGEGLSEKDLRGVAGKIRGVWLDFEKRYPGAATGDVGVETWRQRQADVVGPIEKQRTLVIIIMAIMSIVAVALIFVILYTIVMQKTREIGVLKAVGASSGGVATLFFAFGAVVGLIGAVLGTVGGYFTVLHINGIQDWVDGVFGFRVWSADMYMFALIPNEVDWRMAIFILIGSILAGLAGALLPAIRAARM